MSHKGYHLALKEELLVILVAFGTTAVIAILFYRSGWAMFLLPIFLLGIRNRAKENGRLKQQQEMQEQFLNGIRVLNTSLQAGMSMERAWKEVEKETKLLYGEKSLFYQEISEMNNSVALNIPIEKLFLDIANRSGIEDMIQFAESFEYGKRSGGNWKRIIESTVHRICEKNDANQQIVVMVAEKKMEQQVMNVIPLGVLAFLQFSSWDYMSVMYHNPIGILCMTIGLIGYGASVFLSEKILQIKV